ncbi:MAG: nucleotidyl transferase AbiEii/AbiGii toxin family protein [Anaerolineae bacterium]|nr:nucleotidyl transferase AbiEii/AbiGii toxin family protein [Anaerolineae bacterium]
MSKAMQLKARIKNMASKNTVPAQAVLQNYMLERVLERITVSRYRDMFILKGGMLIASLVGIDHRTTMDMDATLRGYPLSEQSIEQALEDICSIQLDDEVTLTVNHVKPIRSDDEYGGYRASLIAEYDTIKTPLKIDITSGDAITPAAVRYPFPSLFSDKVIEVWAYNIETILAEKIETILRRSVLNTRPRDFYDAYLILKTQADSIHAQVLKDALMATCEKRASSAELEDRGTILRTIQEDSVMRQRWDRYCNEYTYAQGITFDEALEMIQEAVSA